MNTFHLTKTANLMWWQIDWLTLLRKGVWLFILIVSIVYSLVGSWDQLMMSVPGLDRWVDVYLSFFSFVLGVLAGAIIFLRKPNSWMAFATSIMLVTFTATDGGLGFWYHVFTGEAFTWESISGASFAIGLFTTVVYLALNTTSLAFVLMTFPEGKMPSRASRWFFLGLVASQIITILVIGAICLLDIFYDMGGYLSLALYLLLDVIKGIILVFLCLWPMLRLRRTQDPVQRQQVKWIVATLTGMAFFYALQSITLFVDVTLSLGLPDAPYLWLYLICLLFTYAFIVTLFMAILRFRLWDIGVLVNRALVYSSLTAVLGVAGYSGAAALDLLVDQFTDSDSPLGSMMALLLLAAVFNPARERMQGMVDRHFKPEEIDFSRAIVEIAPESQLHLSSGEILKILVRQSVEQLNLAGATIFLKWPDGQLVQSEPPAPNPMAPDLLLDEKTRAQLEKGKVVPAPEGSDVSLYVPLLIVRASRPDFIGVLVLGKRNSGEGYPTPLLNSLQKLGCDAGKAIYLAQYRERLAKNGMHQLSALERGLVRPQRPLNA